MASAKAGYYSLFVPRDLGGAGEGMLAAYAVWHDLYHHYGMSHPLVFEMVAHWATGPSSVFHASSQSVLEGPFRELMSGSRTMCFALSEPDGGSDIWNMRTTASPVGDGWSITGTKQWITNGPQADFALVFAASDPQQVSRRDGGISAFLIPTDSPGFEVAGLIKLFDRIDAHEAILQFDNVRVSDDYRIGEVNQGLSSALSGVGLGRLYNAAKSVGLASWALEIALDYSKARHTFGHPIFEYQGISFPLAECAMEILAAHLLGHHAARLLDDGADAVKEVAAAKAYSTEMALRVIDRAIQTLGGMGLTNESLLTRAWQEVRTVVIADGSAEILRRLIANRLGKGDVAL